MFSSWMVIGAIAFVVALGANIIRPADVKWFKRLRRPQWLTFESLIPVIWTVIFICGAWSAYIVWEANPGNSNTWFLMGFYLLLEVVTIAYTPVTFWSQNLKAGTITGGLGAILALILAVLVWSVSRWATALLLPYLLWSPIGTYTTWVMDKINSQVENG
ncbi:TspO/MBR family protein [Merismopedia glauca]|uniref:TspO protein n=1 Tax=Merismopedia glauca CCAP 1448/3 TaxID=1296344 RepID=A0A2T1C625_9CYAN|nr:TspO/MBR family protein [Merismopedia glauca]PSB03583.1 TspO protein [Merismopedia glauca CCAP 1448/3]